MTHIQEAQIVGLTDDELRDLVGYLFESIKRLEEAMKADPDLQQMVDKVRAYKADNYGDERKRLVAHLKAARCQAEARGLTFKFPALR